VALPAGISRCGNYCCAGNSLPSGSRFPFRRRATDRQALRSRTRMSACHIKDAHFHRSAACECSRPANARPHHAVDRGSCHTADDRHRHAVAHADDHTAGAGCRRGRRLVESSHAGGRKAESQTGLTHGVHGIARSDGCRGDCPLSSCRAVVHTLRISLVQPSQQTGLYDVGIQFLSRRFLRLRVNFGHSRPTHTFPPRKSRRIRGIFSIRGTAATASVG